MCLGLCTEKKEKEWECNVSRGRLTGRKVDRDGNMFFWEGNYFLVMLLSALDGVAGKEGLSFLLDW